MKNEKLIKNAFVDLVKSKYSIFLIRSQKELML